MTAGPSLRAPPCMRSATNPATDAARSFNSPQASPGRGPQSRASGLAWYREHNSRDRAQDARPPRQEPDAARYRNRLGARLQDAHSDDRLRTEQARPRRHALITSDEIECLPFEQVATNPGASPFMVSNPDWSHPDARQFRGPKQSPVVAPSTLIIAKPTSTRTPNANREPPVDSRATTGGSQPGPQKAHHRQWTYRPSEGTNLKYAPIRT